MKSAQPKRRRLLLLAVLALLLSAAFALFFQRDQAAPATAADALLPVLSDPDAGLSLTLPASAQSFTRRPAAQDRFLSTIPYADNQTLLYIHHYTIPLRVADDPPAIMDTIVTYILRDELGSYLTLDSSFDSITLNGANTPVMLLHGRARDPDSVIGCALQVNQNHFVFFGLRGPALSADDLPTFFAYLREHLRVASANPTSYLDIIPYQKQILSHDDPREALDFIRNLFATRNANPAYYQSSIIYAFLLARAIHQQDPGNSLFPETLHLLNTTFSIRLADYLRARRDFEVALGKRDYSEALAQADFLAKLSFPFDHEASSLAKRRLRKVYALRD